MFETLISDIATRFGLGDKAPALLGSLINLIFEPASGGFAGFINRFKDAGLGDTVSSWVGGDAPRPIDSDQVARALGSGTLVRLGDTLNLPSSTIGVALAAMLPKVIGELTPGGQIPSAPPAGLGGLLGGLGAMASGIGRSAQDAAGKAAPAARAVPREAGDTVQRGGGMNFLRWLIPVIIILGILYFWAQNKEPEVVAPTSTPPATTPAAAKVPTTDARLELGVSAGQVNYAGEVGSDADKTRLVDALKSAFGDANTSGNLSIDANTRPAGWLDALIGALPALKQDGDGAKLSLDGQRIGLGGNMDAAHQGPLVDALKAAFPGYTYSGLLEAGANAPAEPSAPKDAASALAALHAGQSSGEDLVKALNLMDVQFDSGKASIHADSQAILDKAAAAIKQAAPDTRIEIGGYTDNTGNAAANLKLSSERADAVRTRLVALGVAPDILVAKGYGDANPIADNSTEEGRARNRRMEFKVLH